MILFLHGDDTYRSREKLRELKEKFLREVDPSGSNLVTIDGTTANASEVWGAIAAQSFLVRKRMVVIERIGAQKSSAAREEVAALLERIPEDVIAVFWEEKSRAPTGGRGESRGAKRRGIPAKKKAAGVIVTAKRSDPLFTKLLEGKYAQEFAPLEGVALTRWVVDAAKALGAAIAPDATRDLITIVGADLWRMRNEIEKLTNAAAAQRSSSRGAAATRDLTPDATGTTITSALIRDLVATVPQEDVFGFVDAIGRGDRITAIRIIRELEAARVDPQYLLAMIHRQLRLLVMASDLLERGTPVSQLASALGVHPFVAQKLSQQARTASSGNLRELYPRLLDLDQKLKSSRTPWEALMELFVLDTSVQ